MLTRSTGTMKLLAFVTLFACVHLSYQEETPKPKCQAGVVYPDEASTKLSNMEFACSEILKGQIKKEFEAAITYMAMAAHFSGASHFRPGLAKFFLKSASEERMHAKKIMEFLLMRGEPITKALFPPIRAGAENATTVSWKSAQEALEKAYSLEKSVTESIVEILKRCENASGEKNDYHAVDYITADFLAEQHEGLRAISEYITSLKRMGNATTLGEILFDKTLLKD